MNIILDDVTLRRLLTEDQLHALVRLRDCAFKMKCRTMRDSLAMTSMNMLPLFIKERGTEWAQKEVERILVLLVGAQPEKKACRQAAKEFLSSLRSDP